MSKDVSLVFDVNVEDSTSIMKGQLQGIFDEINKVPHSLHVNIDIDKSSLTESTRQIEEVRAAISSINPQQGFLTYLDNINSTIKTINSNMLKMPIREINSDTNATYKSMDEHLNKIRGKLLGINNALSKLTKQFADVDDSNKIFGFSENLEKIKNTLESISNSFSGVFKGANGDIINFETHLNKISGLMEGMYNKAFVMPSINKDNATGNVIGEQVGQIQGAESEIAKLISVLSDLRNAFNTFIQNGDEGVLNFAGGLVYLNNTLNGITTSVGAVENAIRSMLSNSDGEVLNYTQHLETISSILGEISNKTINTSSLDTDFSFDQNGSSNTEAKNKRRAKSEKELEDAVEQETAAEEKRKITLTQFLTLYEKLVDLENRNTHMTGTDKYSNLVESKNALTDTYNQLKDSLVEIDNILELSSVDEEKLAQAFDRGTIAAKQFKTALPTVSDGVKVQDALKAINSANSVITKFDNADGDKNNTSYGNLKSLVEDLESRVDRTAGAFRELDSTASGAGNKISDIMRKIVIESENLKAETASQVLENKAKKAAEGENALADSVKAENEEEKKRLISLKEFLDLHTNLKNLVNQNTIMDGKSDQYGKAVSVLGEMNEAYNQLITQETNLEDITKVLGEDIVNTFDRGKLAAEQLKAAIPNESDGVKYESVLTKINSVNRLMNSNKSMEITNPEQWKKLADGVAALEGLIDRDKNQFKSLGEEGSKSAGLISEQMRIVTAETENFKNAIPVATVETNAFNTVAAQIERMGKLLRTNSHLEGSEYYEQLKASMTELNGLLDRTSGKILEIANEAEGEGTKLSNAINKSELSIINFNYEVNNTKKEAKEAAVSLEKMIGQMNGWKRSLVSASKQGLTSDNDKDFKKLSDLLALFDRVRAAMKDNPALTMSQALNAEGLSQAAAIEKIMQANIASKDLTRTVINLRNNELSLNATEKERDAILSKSYRLLSSMTAALKNWDRAKTGKTSESYSQIKESSIALSKYIKQLEEGKINVEQFNKEIAKIRYSFESNSAIIKNAGENVRSFGSNLKRVFSSFSMWFSLTSIVMRAYNSMRKMASASIELNDAMTQLKIVTDETDSTYETFGSTLANVAKRTASSISDITTSATTYARLGYSLEDAAKIAEYTAKLQNVGDIQVSDAQDAITAILKAYDGIDANHIEDVMNKLVVTGNKFPISVSQIAEGMNNASSALAAAGNTFEQSVALLTAANTTIQDAAKSSTAMRTIAARLRKTDSELEALGESMTSSKYDALVKSLADLNVGLVDVNGEYRATYDIIADIASKWDSMSSMEQAALADLAAGTRQQSAFYSLIEQFKEASGAMEAMAGSAGVLDNAYATYMGSTTAHINQFKAAFQELSSNTFNSNFLSKVTDVGTSFVEFANAVAKARLGLVSLASAIGLAAFVSWRKNVAADITRAQVLSANLIAEKKITDQLSISVAALNQRQVEVVRSKIDAALASEKLSYEEFRELSANLDLMVSEKGLEGENYALATSFEAVTAAIPVWGWFIIGLTAATVAIGAAVKKSEELRQAFAEDTEKIKEETDVLNEYKKRLKDIQDSDADPTERLKEYNDLRQDLIDAYDIHIGKIEDETEAVRILNDELDRELRNKRQLYLVDNKEQYEKTKELGVDFEDYTGNFWADVWKKLTRNPQESKDWREITIAKAADKTSSREEARISDNILKLFDKGSSNLWDKASFSIGKEAKGELELLETLKEAYIRFGEIKDAREEAGGSLTEGEQLLFDKLKEQYKALEDHLGESGINYNNAIEYAKDKMDELVAKFPQGTKALGDWEQFLIDHANGDELVIEQIKNMIDGLRELEQTAETDPFDELAESLERLKGKLEQVNETIKTANDYFEDLAKVIDKNKETDKFFTADEMIDMLDKYPELSDNILVTSYGYKFQADALEELRQARLKEQKTAIYTQISESKGALAAAEKELAVYQAKLTGITTLAEAETELAIVEEQLNSGKFEEGGYIEKQLSEKTAKLKNFIDATKKIADLRQDIEKATMQYTLLGNVFDDLKDKTNDSTKAMNDHKSTLKDMADDYKDAKDAIEDLVKLTIEMLKKNAELRKEELKEQLDGFKKLIAKRKELIDLEKDQYDFERKLKDQNRDLLKIQQELDALSVEGVEYSLEDMKRKAELEEKLTEEEQSRADFLYDHEVDVRKKALDDELASFEEQINTQIKEIENYLDRTGRLRQDAVDLINGQSQEFYNDLFNYTQTYTDKSKAEFQDLWDRAYAALIKYGNGQIDVDMTLAFLIGRIAQVENEMKILESQINSAKESADRFVDGFVDGMEDVNKVIAEDIEAMNTFANLANGVKAIASSTSKNVTAADMIAANFQHGAKANTAMMQMLKYIPLSGVKYEVHHSGGIAGGSALTKDSEILAKLLAGEVVVTTAQASNFMKSTLPKLAAATNISNQMSPTISIGDINIAGDADSTTVSQLKAIQKEIVNDVFKTINSQKNIFIGGKIR